jgi:hypothetical protein
VLRLRKEGSIASLFPILAVNRRMISNIRQREKHDCGVACAAMLLNIPYEEARELFIAEKLHERKRPFSSKVGEVQRILGISGKTAKRQIFKDWQSLQTPCIAKTLVTSKGWHWVVIDRHPEYGLYVLDPWPTVPFPCFEFPPLNTTCMSLSVYLPEGSCLYLE